MVQKWYGNIPLILIVLNREIRKGITITFRWNCRSQVAILSLPFTATDQILLEAHLVSIIKCTLSKLGFSRLSTRAVYTKSNQLRENQIIKKLIIIIYAKWTSSPAGRWNSILRTLPAYGPDQEIERSGTKQSMECHINAIHNPLSKTECWPLERAVDEDVRWD